MKTSTNYSLEVRERAVRLVREPQGDYPSQWAALHALATCQLSPLWGSPALLRQTGPE